MDHLGPPGCQGPALTLLGRELSLGVYLRQIVLPLHGPCSSSGLTGIVGGMQLIGRQASTQAALGSSERCLRT